jgi:uncharacterized protein YegL
MSGTPMTSLKQGAIMILNSVLKIENAPFESLVTVTYDNRATDYVCRKHSEIANMENIINKLQASGSTDFNGAFEKLF